MHDVLNLRVYMSKRFPPRLNVADSRQLTETAPLYSNNTETWDWSQTTLSINYIGHTVDYKTGVLI